MLGLYITRTGYYRIEDQNKIRNLYRQYGPIVIPEKYLRMSTMIRKENPKEYSNQVMRDSLNYWTNNLFSRLLDAAKMEHTG